MLQSWTVLMSALSIVCPIASQFSGCKTRHFLHNEEVVVVVEKGECYQVSVQAVVDVVVVGSNDPPHHRLSLSFPFPRTTRSSLPTLYTSQPPPSSSSAVLLPSETLFSVVSRLVRQEAPASLPMIPPSSSSAGPLITVSTTGSSASPPPSRFVL